MNVKLILLYHNCQLVLNVNSMIVLCWSPMILLYHSINTYYDNMCLSYFIIVSNRVTHIRVWNPMVIRTPCHSNVVYVLGLKIRHTYKGVLRHQSHIRNMGHCLWVYKDLGHSTYYQLILDINLILLYQYGLRSDICWTHKEHCMMKSQNN